MYLAWLTLPSRLPALGLAGLLALGLAARRYAARNAAVRLALPAEHLALAAIMAGAAGLRFAGLPQSLPYFDNPDEPTLTNAAIRMLQTGDLNPHFFRWPSLPFYVQFAVSVPQFFSDVGRGVYTDLKSIAPEGYFLAGRVVSASLGTATVFLTYLLGRRLYGPAAGLLAALTLAVLPLHSEHSHYVTPDIMVTFFATLTLLFAVLVYQTGRRGWYLWAGVAAGLTLGSKYNVGIVLLAVALAHWLAPAPARGRLRWLAGAGGLALLTFLATTPFTLLDLPGFLNEIAFQVRHYTILGHGAASEGASWSAYLRYFWQEGFTYQASLAALAGVVFALLRQRREDLLVVAFPLAGYFFFSAAKVHFARNLLPLLPALAVLSAVVMLWLVARLADRLPAWSGKMQPVLLAGLWLSLFCFALLHSVLTDRYYLQPDTRKLAGEWVVRQLPAGARLRLEPGGPILPAGRYKNASEFRPVGAHPPEWFKENGYNYLIASSTTYEELSRSDPQAAANYRQVFERFRLLQEFKGGQDDRPGPTIKILEVQ